MTLRMGDGPVDNIPTGLDAVAGYVNVSGIGITFPQLVAKFPGLHHLSITTDGAPAMCADVEAGAMSDWSGYQYGYCSVSNVNAMVARYGRPSKLWTSHYDPAIGPHICSPACWPGLVTTADGTQWTDHGPWDESLLNDEFFLTGPIPAPPSPPSPPPIPQEPVMLATSFTGNGYYIAHPDGSVWAEGDAVYQGGANPGAPAKAGGPAIPAGLLAPGEVITSITAHPHAQGYWLRSNDAHVFAFGACSWHGNA